MSAPRFRPLVLGLLAALVASLAGTAAPAAAEEGAIPGRGFLPNDRGWEKVSPVEKNDNDLSLGANYQASADGNRIVFASGTAFGEAVSAAVVTQYLGVRGPGGWSTRSVMPPMGPDLAAGNPDKFRAYQGFDEGLKRGAYRGGLLDPVPAEGTTGAVRNIFRADLDAGTFDLLSPEPDPLPDPMTILIGLPPMFGGASEDFDRIVFEAMVPLTPDAPPAGPPPYGTSAVYEWSGGQTRLVSVLPDGSPASDASGLGLGIRESYTGFVSPRAVSHDGRRIFFTTPLPGSGSHPLGRPNGAPPPRVYLREDGETVEVSASQRSVPDPDPPSGASFETASVDGGRAFFLSCEKLTDDSVAFGSPNCNGGSAALYMYDVASGDLSDLTTVDPQGADVIDVLGADEAGTSVYFIAGGVLAPGGVRGESNVYVWRAGEIRHVAILDDAGGRTALAAATGTDGDNRPLRRYAGVRSRISADGRYLLFVSERRQGGYDNAGYRLLYRYDWEADEVECISCGPGDGPATANVAPHENVDGNPVFDSLAQHLPRQMSDDGRRVFFSTPQSLVAADVNGVSDVYQWEEGELRLLSDGRGPDAAYFMDASADGDSVFIITRNHLTPDDHDQISDVYVARVGGGVPVERGGGRAPCEGDGCQPAGAAPTRRSPGSGELDGPGDVVAVKPATLRLSTLSRAQRARLAAGGRVRVRVRVRVNRPGRVRVGLRATASRRQVRLGGGSVRARRAGQVAVPVKLSKAGMRRLSESRRLRVALDVRFAGQAKRLTLTLRKGGSR